MTEVSELTEELTISKPDQDTFDETSEICEVQGEDIKVQEQSKNNGWGEESMPAGDGWGEVSSTIEGGWGENVAIEENTNENKGQSNDYWGEDSSAENLSNLWTPEKTVENFEDNSTTCSGKVQDNNNKGKFSRGGRGGDRGRGGRGGGRGRGRGGRGRGRGSGRGSGRGGRGRESPQRNWDNFEHNSGGSGYRGYGRRDFSSGGGGGGGYRYNGNDYDHNDDHNNNDDDNNNNNKHNHYNINNNKNNNNHYNKNEDYSPEQSPKERKPGSLYESIHAPKRGSAPYVNEDRVKSGGVSRRMDRMDETQLKDLMEKMNLQNKKLIEKRKVVEEEEERFRKEEEERNKRDLEDSERQKMILQEEEEIRKRHELQKKKLQEELYMERERNAQRKIENSHNREWDRGKNETGWKEDARQRHNNNDSNGFCDDEQENDTRNSSHGDGKKGQGCGKDEQGVSKRDDGGGSRRYSDQSKEFSSHLNEDKRFGDGNSWAEQQEQHIADNTGNIWNENNNENNELDPNKLDNKEDCMKNASWDVETTESNQLESYWDEGTETNHQDDYWG